MALKEAERKHLEKERLADEREQQIRHLTQLLQSGVCMHSSWFGHQLILCVSVIVETGQS